MIINSITGGGEWMVSKLPIGIQGFEKLRNDNFLYIDKSEYIYNLVHNNVPYFLSRPRRFGKSLLLSTLRAYWEGKKELFDGLKITALEGNNAEAWKKYPVFYFDFNGENYNTSSIEEVLEQHLMGWEDIYGNKYQGESLGFRFEKLLEMAYKKTGLRCVVLVDEYDKPLLDVINDSIKENHTKDVFKGFFSRLKKADEFVQFVFITGVSKFHKVSIFSDLNQLRDISLNKEYSGICGITDEELNFYFKDEIKRLSENQKMTVKECISVLKSTYDGYCFHPSGVNVYNPYSILNAFSDGEFGSYWFETGTPTFLIKKIRESSFDIRKFTNGTLYADESVLKDYTGDNPDPVPLLFQTGYLTIADYDKRLNRYTLRFPNDEVAYGFLKCLIPEYIPRATAGNGLDIFTIIGYVENANLEKIRDTLVALFAGIPYTQKQDPFEHDFQSVIYILFTLIGQYVQCEMHTFNGRIDCKVETPNYVYLFEFKRDQREDEALKQIDSKDYALPFAADSRKLFKIGVSFDSATRMLSGWKVAE